MTKSPNIQAVKLSALLLSNLESFMTACYLYTRVYALYDKISALYGPCSENIHDFEERGSLSSLKRITSTMVLFVADSCGLEPIAKQPALILAATNFSPRPNGTWLRASSRRN